MVSIIETKDLNQIYGVGETKVHALKDINLEIEKGDLVAVMGPSGSGKSSLLHVIGAMLTPTSGEISINGNMIQNFTRKQLAEIRRNEIGFIFQSFALINHLNAIENVMIPLYPLNLDDTRKRATELLTKVGLSHRFHHLPTELSGGEKQRVAIARALINKPSILLGDEITGNLDTQTGKEIFKLIRELNDEGITFLLVTHDNTIAKSCKRIIELKDGKLLQ